MSLWLLLTKLGPQGIVGVRLGQQVHALGRVLLQEDLDRWLAVGHDGGHPGQVVGQDGRQQCRQEPGTDTHGWLALRNFFFAFLQNKLPEVSAVLLVSY